MFISHEAMCTHWKIREMTSLEKYSINLEVFFLSGSRIKEKYISFSTTRFKSPLRLATLCVCDSHCEKVTHEKVSCVTLCEFSVSLFLEI